MVISGFQTNAMAKPIDRGVTKTAYVMTRKKEPNSIIGLVKNGAKPCPVAELAAADEAD
jgi:hypothetical protein